MSMSPSQARVVDPVLTNLAHGYTQPEFIAEKLFPVVPCPKRGVKVVRFSKEGFRKQQTRRAPGADTQRIFFGFESDPVALHQEQLEAVVPREYIEETADIPVDISQMEVNLVLESILLGHEVDCAAIAQNAGNYGNNNKVTLTAGSFWDDPTTDLKLQVKEYRAAVRKRIGRNPNVLMLPNDIFEACKVNEKVMAQFKYTSSESITEKMLANYFDVDEVAVGKALMLAADGVTLEDIWGKVVLAYVPPKNQRGMKVPSYGYTYRLKGYPMVEKAYWDDRAKSWVHPVTDELSPELTAMDAGFLVDNPYTP